MVLISIMVILLLKQARSSNLSRKKAQQQQTSIPPNTHRHILLKNDSPFISFVARMKSWGSLKLTKPKPLVLFVLLSRITLAFRKEEYLLNALVSTSSVTSLPRSPQNRRKSSEIQKQSLFSVIHFIQQYSTC